MELIPEVYSRVLPFDTELHWDPEQWIPQVVIINLGTNDFGKGVPDSKKFITEYTNFVGLIRDHYPSANIYCALGPLLSGVNLIKAREFIKTAVKSYNSSGDSKVRFIEFPMQTAANGYGEDWHPIAKTHQLMAYQLVKQLENDLKW
jgi:lysophospholipase L1-like esterase